MALELTLFRHAKSDWHADVGGDDFRRPLSTRGRRSAWVMGRFLTRSGKLPDHVLTSPATRANDTLRRSMRAGSWRCSVEVRPKIYGNLAGVLEEIRRVDVGVRSLMVVGHETALVPLAGYLSGCYGIRLPTAAMLHLIIPVDRWCDVDGGSAIIEWLVTPRLVDGRARTPTLVDA